MLRFTVLRLIEAPGNSVLNLLSLIVLRLTVLRLIEAPVLPRVCCFKLKLPVRVVTW